MAADCEMLLCWAAALGIVNHLRRRFARFKLCAHLLEARSESFNLLLQFSYGRFLFLVLAVLFEELVSNIAFTAS